jgi:hypothetical protein
MQHTKKLSIMLLVLILNSSQAWADNWQQTGSVKISTEHDSNPAMSPITYLGDVWYQLIEPNYTMLGKFGEDELSMGLGLYLRLSGNEALRPNRNNPSVFLNWLRQIESGNIGVSSRYAEIATSDGGIDGGGQVPVDSTRISRTLSGKWSNSLSERSTLVTDVLYENIFYKGGNFIDYTNRAGSMMLDYALSEYNSIFIKLTRLEYVPVQSSLATNSYTNTAVAGWNWKASENLEGSLQAGKSRINDTDISSQGAATVKFTGERNTLSLSADRQVVPSGFGGFVTADQRSGSWSYELSDHSRTGVDMGLQTNLSTNITNRTEGVWLQNELDSFWGVRTYYLHKYFYGGDTNGASANVVGISFVYTNNDF